MASCGNVTVRRQSGTGNGNGNGNGDGGESGGPPEVPYIGELSLDNPRAVGAGIAAIGLIGLRG